MKAIRVHGPKDVRYEEVPEPQTGADDVLIRVKAAALCGTDLEFYDGTMFYITSGMTSLPLIPGHEWAGEVVAVGSDVHEFTPGDRVTGECSVSCRSCPNCIRGWYNQCQFRTETGLLNRDGGFAEYISFPKYFLHKCNRMAFDEASFIEPTGIALYPTKLAQVCPQDYVAVMGPGPIGLFAVQTAKAYGARKVILVGTRDERLEIGRQVGADATVNVKRENLVEKVQAVTDGHMIDVVIEAVGKASVWDDIVSILAPRARIAMTGLFAGQKCAVDFDPLVINNISILGCLGGPSVWDEAIYLHESGKVTAKPIITHRLPLEKFVEGIEIMRHRTDNAVKIVLEP
ncbi:MAG: alcohol dehydrogenase catalytic domain-containing protein [Desulfobacterales bacterium]|jgi:2-desacetyl-2-hydroxyethyl bacteriochlorophyllide A dehydrogenase